MPMAILKIVVLKGKEINQTRWIGNPFDLIWLILEVEYTFSTGRKYA